MLRNLCVIILALSISNIAKASILEDIENAGVLKVATEAAYEPYEFVVKGEIVGFGRDLLDLLADELDTEVRQVNLPFNGILAGMEAGKYDLVATSVGINESRAMKYAFTRPIGYAETVLVKLKSNSSIETPEDLIGKVVATQLGSSVEPIAKEHNQKLLSENGEQYKKLQLYQTFPEVFMALSSKKVEAIFVSSTQVAILNKKFGNKFEIVADMQDRRYLSWAVRSDSVELRDRINQLIDKLESDGSLQQLQVKWLGHEMIIPETGYLPEGAI